MSDPQPTPGKRRPPRAEPLQPDRPTSGDHHRPEPDSGDEAAAVSRETAEQQKVRSERALRNVRQGYG